MTILLELFVIAVLGGIVYYAIGFIHVRQELKTAALAIVAILFVLWLLQAVGIFHPFTL